MESNDILYPLYMCVWIPVQSQNTEKPSQVRINSCIIFKQALCAARLWGCTQSGACERGHNVFKRSRNPDINRAQEKPLFCSRLTQRPWWITCGWPPGVSCDESVQNHLGPPSSYWLAVISWKQTLMGYVVAKHQHQDCFCLTFSRVLLLLFSFSGGKSWKAGLVGQRDKTLCESLDMKYCAVKWVRVIRMY